MRVVILYNETERMLCGEYGERLAELSLKEELKIVEESLGKLGYEFRTIAISNSVNILGIANLVDGLAPDCVFNLVEAVNGNSSLEMNFPAILELMGIPYTGSGPLTLGLCQDKIKSKAVLQAHGVLVPKMYLEWQECKFPVIIKPSHEDGSLGINAGSVAHNDGELFRAISDIEKVYNQDAIVEEYIDGREFGIGVIDFNGGPISFPCSEIVFDGFPDGHPRIVTYDAKWLGGSVEYENSKPNCPADISHELSRKMQDLGLRVFKLFNCKGYARIDMRVRDGVIYVIEVNPNSDIAPGSGIHTVLRAAGVSYEEFVKNLIDGALRGR